MNDVENLRKRAKRIVRDHRAGLVTVAERLRRGLPRFADMSDVEVLEVDDVKVLFLELRDRGAPIHQNLRTEPWGQLTFVVRDPDSNLISFGSPMP